MAKYPLIRKIYLYLFSLIGLGLMAVGTTRLVSLLLRTYVLTKADVFYQYPAPRPPMMQKETGFEEPSSKEVAEFESKQRIANHQREAAEALAQIIVGLPLYLYHWSVIRRDKREEND